MKMNVTVYGCSIYSLDVHFAHCVYSHLNIASRYLNWTNMKSDFHCMWVHWDMGAWFDAIGTRKIGVIICSKTRKLTFIINKTQWLLCNDFCNDIYHTLRGSITKLLLTECLLCMVQRCIWFSGRKRFSDQL